MSSESNIRRRRDITGIRFVRLTATRYIEITKKWECHCDCGNIITVKIAQLNNGNTKSCGCLKRDTMSDVATKRHMETRVRQGRDKDTPLSSFDALERHRSAPVLKSVMIRDDYTCAWCSTRGCELAVHHINTWASCPSRRFDKTNLVTLCLACHIKVHNDDYSVEPDPVMSILLEGYAKEMEAPCEHL